MGKPVDAMKLLSDGLSVDAVARRFRVSRRTVFRWQARFRSKGREDLGPRSSPGRPMKLSNVQQEILRSIVTRDARLKGFPDPRWSRERVLRLILAEFGVRYHVDSIGRLLKKLAP